MLFDVHAHVQFNAFKDDADEVIKRAEKHGVYMIAPSSQGTTSERALEYAEKYPGRIWAGVGLHPIHLTPAFFDPSEEGAPAFHTRVEEFSLETYRYLAAQPSVVAIGETGLDYADRLELSEADRRKQEDVFRAHIELALETDKPIIQHTRSGAVAGIQRDAHDDALRIISEYVPRGLRGVAHCYSGNIEQAEKYIDCGFYISFTGLITFVHAWDEVIRELPLARILSETDCPYMTPEPHRGKRNEPMYIEFVVRKIAELKGRAFEEIARQTSENAMRLFRISFS